MTRLYHIESKFNPTTQVKFSKDQFSFVNDTFEASMFDLTPQPKNLKALWTDGFYIDNIYFYYSHEVYEVGHCRKLCWISKDGKYQALVS